jgi:hypothetical protein
MRTPEEIKRAIVYVEENMDKKDAEEMTATIMCESGFQVDPKHNGISWGVAQFTPATWKDFGYGDIMNPEAQLLTMARIWGKYKNRWDCFRLGLYKQYLK